MTFCQPHHELAQNKQETVTQCGFLIFHTHEHIHIYYNMQCCLRYGSVGIQIPLILAPFSKDKALNQLKSVFSVKSSDTKYYSLFFLDSPLAASRFSFEESSPPESLDADFNT